MCSKLFTEHLPSPVIVCLFTCFDTGLYCAVLTALELCRLGYPQSCDAAPASASQDQDYPSMPSCLAVPVLSQQSFPSLTSVLTFPTPSSKFLGPLALSWCLVTMFYAHLTGTMQLDAGALVGCCMEQWCGSSQVSRG